MYVIIENKGPMTPSSLIVTFILYEITALCLLIFVTINLFELSWVIWVFSCEKSALIQEIPWSKADFLHSSSSHLYYTKLRHYICSFFVPKKLFDLSWVELYGFLAVRSQHWCKKCIRARLTKTYNRNMRRSASMS